MAAHIAKWRAISGLRYTSADDVVNIIVETYAGLNPAAENGILGVLFVITDNNGATLNVPVYTKTWAFPYFGENSKSRLPNANPNYASPCYGYSVAIPMAAFPVGKITITATSYANNGHLEPLPFPIRIYNDTDGIDRRPNKKEIWVNPSTGSDANVGDEEHPVATLSEAFFKGRNNPSGSASADSDLGGLVIHLSDHLHYAGGSTIYRGEDVHTSEDRWVQVISDSGNARLQTFFFPDLSGVYYPQSYVFANGYNNSGNFNLRISNCKIEDKSFSLRPRPSSSVNCKLWIDGGESYSTAPRTKDHSVRFFEKIGACGDISMNEFGATGSRYRICTGHYRHHSVDGWHGWNFVYDCSFVHWTAIAFQASGDGITNDYSNNYIADQQLYNDPLGGDYDTEGYFFIVDGDRLGIYTSGLPAGVAAVRQLGTITKIDGGGVSRPFATTSFLEAGALVGSVRMFLRLAGWPSPNNNGIYPVLGVGVDLDGLEYALFANPNAVAQTGLPSSEISTGMPNGEPWNYTHTDLFQYFAGANKCLYSSNISVNLRQTQRFFFTGGTVSNIWIVNSTDGSYYELNPLTGTNIVDSGFINNTFNSRVYLASSPQTNVTWVNNVFYNSNGLSTTGAYIDSNHWIDTSSFGSDSVRGTNASSGNWFENVPTEDPYSVAPQASRYDTGSTAINFGDLFKWSGSTGTTKGVTANIGDVDWQNVTPAGEAPVAVTINAGVLSISLGNQAASLLHDIFANAGTRSVTMLIRASSVKVSVVISASTLAITMNKYSAGGVTTVAFTNSTKNISCRIRGARLRKDAFLNANMLTIDCGIITQSANGAVQVSNTGFTHIELKTRSAVASTISPILAESVNIDIGINACSVVVDVFAYAQKLSVVLTVLQQSGDLFIYHSKLSISMGIQESSTISSILANAGSLDISFETNPVMLDIGVIAGSLETDIAINSAVAVGTVVVNGNLLNMDLSINAVDVTSATIGLANKLNMTMIAETPIIQTAVSETVFKQAMYIDIKSADLNLEATVTANSLNMLMTLVPSELAGTATAINIPIPMDIEILPATATYGQQAYASSLFLITQLHPASTSTDATFVASVVQIVINVYSATQPVTVTAGLATISTTINGIVSEQNVTVTNQIKDIKIAVESASAYGTIPVSYVEEYVSGVAREKLNDIELLPEPILYEEWRVVFDPNLS